MPLVSVVIPTYNMAAFIGQAISSVLAQSMTDLELVVVDDGSTDETAQVVSGFGDRVSYIHQANNGGNSARNRGVAAAHGRYVAFLDADDTWLPEKLELQLRVFDEYPSVGFVGCGYQVQNHDGTRSHETVVRRNYPSRDAFVRALQICQILPGSASGVVVRRQTLLEAGPFDQSIRIAEDWDMWLRLAQLCDVHFVEQVLVTIRRHGGKPAFRNLANFERWHRYVIEKNIPAERRPAALAMMHARLGSSYLVEGRPECALSHLAMSFRLRPIRLLPFDPLRRYQYPKVPRHYLLMKSAVRALAARFSGTGRS